MELVGLEVGGDANIDGDLLEKRGKGLEFAFGLEVHFYGSQTPVKRACHGHGEVVF